MFILMVVGKKHPLEFFLQNKHHCKTFFSPFRQRLLTAGIFTLHCIASLRARESICTVRVKLFKGYYHLTFYFKKVERIKMERRINDIKSSICPAAREPGGSAGMKIFHSRQCCTKRQLWREQIAGLPFPACQDFREVSDFVFHSNHKLFSLCGNYLFVCMCLTYNAQGTSHEIGGFSLSTHAIFKIAVSTWLFLSRFCAYNSPK